MFCFSYNYLSIKMNMHILIKIQNLARKITRNRKIFLNSKLSFTKTCYLKIVLLTLHQKRKSNISNYRYFLLEKINLLNYRFSIIYTLSREIA
ncbi:hypothetical protein K756_05550 [Glaesserella parasuis ZJ0906]|uniref:Uncharacterized protein n=1 Tax=Glaesserella parasuis ZJ0906 TaxID=1322346 RepID=A0A806JE08_GLAPU|nr:hypothetical protein K756_05550 [Glaesserella parasuis ZJ0906]